MRTVQEGLDDSVQDGRIRFEEIKQALSAAKVGDWQLGSLKWPSDCNHKIPRLPYFDLQPNVAGVIRA